LSVGVDIFGYLIQRKVSVTGVIIDSPRVTIIRGKDGAVNVASLGSPALAGGAVSQTSNKISEPPAFPPLLISFLKIENGAVTYIDNSFDPAVSVDVTDLSALVSKISLTDPFLFIVEAAVFSEKKNIKLEGKAQLNLATGDLKIFDVAGAVGLADIVMAKIPISLPMAKGAVLPESLNGRLDVKVDAVTLGPKGLGALKADVVLVNGAAQFNELLAPVKDIAANVKLTQADIVMDKASLSIGGGTITCSGSLQDYLVRQGYSIAADIRNIRIQDLGAQDNSAVKIEGIVSGPIMINGEGFTPEALKSTLSGTVDISITKPILKDLNVLRAILDKISVIPGLSENIEAGLPAEYQKKLSRKDTTFSDIKLPVTIQNGRIIITDMSVASEEFMFKGRAESGFDAAYSLEGSFLIAPELSRVMVAGVGQLQYLLNEEKQIYIPLKISGNAANISFIVDANYIGKRLVENQAKQQIFKALDKALGNQETSGGSDQGASQPGSGDNTAVKETVNKILGNIFK
jgi:hypothetical protein